MSKKVTILGGQESGTGAAVLAMRQGMEPFVSDFGTISDEYKSVLQENGIPFEENQHSEEKILASDLVIKSPGVPEKAPMVKKIREAKIQIVSEIEFASWYTNATIIGITGSNGKTTTTMLTYETLKRGGLNVGLAGNIGQSFANAVATQNYTHYVLEISSFQLDDIEKFRPDIAVLLNITPDHLDRYDYEISKYAASKFRIAENQTEEDHFVYCVDDPLTLEHMPSSIKSKKLGFGFEKKNDTIAWFEYPTITVNMEQDKFNMDYDQMRLAGRHNIYNTMAAAIVARVLELKKDTIRESFSDFRNVEHRLEKVARVGGIEFINDSKATNVNAAWYALECVASPIVWIAGGVDKGNDYEILTPLVEKKVKTIIALGEDVLKIHKAFREKVDMIVNAGTMEEAVRLSYHMADKGDTVLLSPACASFDLFENYEDRGRQFKALVRDL